MSSPLFHLARKDDRVVITMLREAVSVDDMQPFFVAFDELFADVVDDPIQNFCVYVDTTAISISPMSVRLGVMKSIYDFLVARTHVLAERVSVCAVLIASRTLSTAVSAMLNSMNFGAVSLDLFHDRDNCVAFLKRERRARRDALHK